MAPTPEVRDAFFLGSGVSLPIAPSTRDLTEIALNQVGAYQLEMDARWRRIGSGALATERSAERRDHVRLVIAALKTHIDAFYACRRNPAGYLARETNYEDLGFLADALAKVVKALFSYLAALPPECRRASLGVQVGTWP